MTYYPEFSRLLNQELQRQDRSASWLAQRLDVSPSTVARWLNHGTRPGAAAAVAQIADLLGITAHRQALLAAAGFAYQPEPGDALPAALVAASPSSEARLQVPPLPRPTTPLVGRTAEIDQISDWLSDPAWRLITIAGPGGMGKTRLALAVAHQQRDARRFANGVAFVDLAPLSYVEQIPGAVAKAIGLPLESGGDAARSPWQQVRDFLRNRQLLLIIDNAEHLLDGFGFIAALIQDAPDVKILITSRVPVRLLGEQVFPLHGLDYADAQRNIDASAMTLFLQTAQRVHPGFGQDGCDRRTIAEICRLVEGMPLAIELAAAWISVMAAEEILASIRRSLHFLESDLRDVAPRHRSMEAVFATTWRQLDARTQQIFAQCAVFRGGFKREAISFVAGADVSDLRALVAAGLIAYDHGRGRYTIHELLRQFAALRLADTPALETATHAAHAAFYMQLVQQRQDALKRRGLQSDLLPLDAEVENVRRAWSWAIAHDQVAGVVATLDELGLYLQWRGLAEEGESGFDAAAALLTRAGETCHQARALAWQAHFARVLGHTERSEELLRQSFTLLTKPALPIAETRAARAFVLMHLGATVAGKDTEAAQAYYAESLALFQETGEQWFAAEVQLGLGHVCLTLGDFDGQRAHVQAALHAYRSLGHMRGAASALSMLADIDSYCGRLISGLHLGLESLAAFRALDDPVGIATSLSRIGYTYMNLGDIVNARQVVTESAAISANIGARRDEVIAHVFLCAVELMAGAYVQAHAHARHALALATDLGDRFVLGVAQGFMGWAQLTIGDLDSALQTLREAVITTDLTGATMDRTRCHAILARAQWENGQSRQAQAHCFQSLRLCAQVGDPWSLATTLSSALIILAGGEAPARALELYGMLKQDPLCAASRWFEDGVRPHMATVTAALPKDVVEATLARGGTLEQRATVHALVDEVCLLGWDN